MKSLKEAKREYLKNHPGVSAHNVQVHRDGKSFVIYDFSIAQCLPFKGDRKNSSLNVSL